MIQLENISKSYRKTKALVQFSAVFENKLYGLLGPNGSGKTTLFRIIVGLIKKDEGTISMAESTSRRRRLSRNEDQGTVSMSTSTSRKTMNIGYLPQSFGLISDLTLEKHMLYFAELKKIDKSWRQQEVERVLELVGLQDKARVKCSALSGGMVRRAGIAQALLGTPDLILLDEATVGLDPEERMRFKLIMTRLSKTCPIILATHIVEDVDALCDQVIVLKEGMVRLNDSVSVLTQQAMNRICVLNYRDLDKLWLKHRVIRLFTDGVTELRMARVLFERELDNRTPEWRELQEKLEGFQLVQPTIEDGYISVTMR